MHPSREALLELGRARVEYKRTPVHMEEVEGHCYECPKCAEIVVAETVRERESVALEWARAEHEDMMERSRVMLEELILLIGEDAAYQEYDTRSDLELEKVLAERRDSQ